MLNGRSQNGNAVGAGAVESPAMGKGVSLSTLPANRESLNRILSFERNVVSPYRSSLR